jgi:glycosyltransferase involved in cell wall biosynthesis
MVFSGAAPATNLANVDLATSERLAGALDRLEQLSSFLSGDESAEDLSLNGGLPPEFKLSIVVPVYNERATIRRVLSQVRALPLPKEIIVVDDCSTDGTRDLLHAMERAADLHMIYKPRNEGKGAALRSGFAAASGDLVVIQDADLEYNPDDIPRLLAPILRGEADVVYGSRFLCDVPQDPSLLHRLGNSLLTRASNCFTGLRLTDMETCYKAFRRDVLRDINIRQNRFGFEPEITAKLARRRYRIREVPVTYNARSYREGKKIGIRDALNAFYCILRYALRD